MSRSPAPSSAPFPAAALPRTRSHHGPPAPSRAGRGSPGSWSAVFLLLALLSASLTQSALAQEQPLQLGATIPDFPVADVVPGLRGSAVTAGPGNVLERFPIEVLAVQHEATLGFPLVLIRASGSFIERTGGVAAGMSGSPVYLPTPLGDALLGAIAYVFAFADHDLALVTPIGAMREGAASAALGATIAVPGIGTATPVATPILMSGASQRTAQFLRQLFRDPSVTPLPIQGAASAAADEQFHLTPGAAIGIQLLRGDIDLTAVGTVTAIEDGSILAFGHPFLGIGAVSLPIVPAYVTAVVPSLELPFKLANVGQRLLGTATQDRPSAVTGRVGLEPAMIPVTVTLSGAVSDSNWRFDVADDERLYPILTAIGVLGLVDRQLRQVGPGYAELAWQIDLQDGTRVNVLEQVNTGSDLSLAVAQLAGGPLAILAANAFREPGLAAVSLSLNLSTDQNVATIEDAVLEEAELVAGGHAIVHVRLQPFRQAAVVRTLSIPLPDDLSGEYSLLIRGGDVGRVSPRLPEERADEEVDQPRSFSELLDALREQQQASELVVESIDDQGNIRRLLRLVLPFVVEESKELTVEIAERP